MHASALRASVQGRTVHVTAPDSTRLPVAQTSQTQPPPRAPACFLRTMLHQLWSLRAAHATGLSTLLCYPPKRLAHRYMEGMGSASQMSACKTGACMLLEARLQICCDLCALLKQLVLACAMV
jgi:hypothetical protein